MICAHCQSAFEAKRPAKFCSGKCRAAASRLKWAGIPGVVRSVRPLKSGKVSVIVHVPHLWAPLAHVHVRGDDLELVKAKGRG